MAIVKVPYGDTGAAVFEQGDDYVSVELFSGSTPVPVTENFPVGSGVVIPAFSVVGLTSGNVVMAENDGDPQAIGITVSDVLNVGAVQSVAVFRAGCFNPDALNWHASYDTDAKKAAAFRGAPTPTNILIRKNL
jgi:hypothetical protein